MVEIAEYYLNTRELKKNAPTLCAGDRVFLSGMVYTARDAAHKRFFELMDKGEILPVDLRDSVIYYAGPTPTPEHLAIGSCGPTTSGRMDPYVPRLMENGLLGMIGKGERNADVCRAIESHQGVYLCAVGGAGALAAKCITKCTVVAFGDLGCESVKRLELSQFPLVVAIDCHGGNLFVSGRKKYAAG